MNKCQHCFKREAEMHAIGAEEVCFPCYQFLMNPKAHKKEALLALADVMEKYSMTMSSEGDYPVFVWASGFDEIILECSDHNLTAEYIREVT